MASDGSASKACPEVEMAERCAGQYSWRTAHACLRTKRFLRPNTIPAAPPPTRSFTNPSVIGTILSTIGIAVAASGGEKKAAPTLPAPAIKDESIAAATGGDKDEEEL